MFIHVAFPGCPVCPDTCNDVFVTGNFHTKTFDDMSQDEVRDMPHNILTANCVAAVGALWACVGLRGSVFEYNKQLSEPDNSQMRAYVLEVLLLVLTHVWCFVISCDEKLHLLHDSSMVCLAGCVEPIHLKQMAALSAIVCVCCQIHADGPAGHERSN